MFCRKCGNQISEGAAFCRKCGTPVAPTQQPTAAPMQPSPVEQTPPFSMNFPQPPAADQTQPLPTDYIQQPTADQTQPLPMDYMQQPPADQTQPLSMDYMQQPMTATMEPPTGDLPPFPSVPPLPPLEMPPFPTTAPLQTAPFAQDESWAAAQDQDPRGPAGPQQPVPSVPNVGDVAIGQPQKRKIVKSKVFFDLVFHTIGRFLAGVLSVPASIFILLFCTVCASWIKNRTYHLVSFSVVDIPKYCMIVLGAGLLCALLSLPFKAILTGKRIADPEDPTYAAGAARDKEIKAKCKGKHWKLELFSRCFVSIAVIAATIACIVVFLAGDMFGMVYVENDITHSTAPGAETALSDIAENGFFPSTAYFVQEGGSPAVIILESDGKCAFLSGETYSYGTYQFSGGSGLLHLTLADNSTLDIPLTSSGNSLTYAGGSAVALAAPGAVYQRSWETPEAVVFRPPYVTVTSEEARKLMEDMVKKITGSSTALPSEYKGSTDINGKTCYLFSVRLSDGGSEAFMAVDADSGEVYLLQNVTEIGSSGGSANASSPFTETAYFVENADHPSTIILEPNGNCAFYRIHLINQTFQGVYYYGYYEPTPQGIVMHFAFEGNLNIDVPLVLSGDSLTYSGTETTTLAAPGDVYLRSADVPADILANPPA